MSRQYKTAGRVKTHNLRPQITNVRWILTKFSEKVILIIISETYEEDISNQRRGYDSRGFYDSQSRVQIIVKHIGCIWYICTSCECHEYSNKIDDEMLKDLLSCAHRVQTY